MKNLFKLMAIAWLAICLPLTCLASSIPDPADDYWYLDQADVLSEETEGLIFYANQRLYDQVEGAEIVVVTVNTTGSARIGDYCYDLMNDWGIGGESHKGLLVLLAIRDKEFYTMPGSAVSSAFRSAHLEELQDEFLEDDFEAGRYDEGVQKYFTELYSELADAVGAKVSIAEARADYRANRPEDEPQAVADTQRGDSRQNTENSAVPARNEQSQPAREPQKSSGGGGLIGGLIAVIAVIVLIVILGRRSRARRMASTMPPPVDGSSNFNVGATMGYMFGRAISQGRRAAPPPPPPSRPGGFGSPAGGPPPRSGGGLFGGSGRSSGGLFGSSSRSSGSSSRSSGSTFGGANRSSGSSRSFGSSRPSSSRSGFGGASRSSRRTGLSTRGGGAGRGGRR